ncbi:MAG TPA: hypothetical protein VI749_08195 [Candidatus Omnitrophota bacterium]|nr:hypothetical protein [Candidatus Omnitrophota bacterium]
MSGLQILVGDPPCQFEHPGTPLEILIAIILRLMNLTQETQSLLENVLRHPEVHLDGIFWFLNAVHMAVMALAAWYAYRLSKSLCFAIALFLPSLVYLTLPSKFGYDQVLVVISNVAPEHLLISAGYFYVMVCLYSLQRHRKETMGEALLWGGICAFGLTTKLTFFPLVILAYVFLRSLRQRLVYSLALLVFAVYCTWPVAPIYFQIFKWFLKLSSHTGPYGSGEVGLLPLSVYVPNVLFMFKQHVFLAVLAVIGLLTLALKKDPPAPQDAAASFDIRNRHIIGIACVILVQFFLAAKFPQPHYMVPAYGLAGLLAGALYLRFRSRKGVTKAFAVLLMLVMMVQSVRAYAYAGHLAKRMSDFKAFSEKVHKEHPGCLIIGFINSSSVPLALFFANGWYYCNTFSPLLEKLYPESYFYNAWTGWISNFTYNVKVAELKKRYPCLMLYGYPQQEWKTNMLEPVDRYDKEMLYRIK